MQRLTSLTCVHRPGIGWNRYTVTGRDNTVSESMVNSGSVSFGGLTALKMLKLWITTEVNHV